jgi:hypothetical protein
VILKVPVRVFSLFVVAAALVPFLASISLFYFKEGGTTTVRTGRLSQNPGFR